MTGFCLFRSAFDYASCHSKALGMNRRGQQKTDVSSSSESDNDESQTAKVAKKLPASNKRTKKQFKAVDKQVLERQDKNVKKQLDSKGGSTSSTVENPRPKPGPSRELEVATATGRERSLRRRTTVTRTRSVTRVRRVTRAGTVVEKEEYKEEEKTTNESE